jgi:enoyl-CoA hydratase/carnithine racemase
MVEITHSGPGKNALGTETITRLRDQLRAANGAPVLLTGAGDAFSAGLDLKEVASLDGPAMERFLLILEDLLTELYLYPGPVVACVNGHAIAGGCMLALCCDHRVMTPNPRARIGLNEVALGLRFPPRTLAIAKARVPAQHWTDVLLAGPLVDPATAVRFGLVDELADDPLAIARTRLESLAALPSDAYAVLKRELRGTPESLCTAERQREFVHSVMPAWVSPELKARIASVLRK